MSIRKWTDIAQPPKVSYADRPKYLQQPSRHNNSGSVCVFVVPYVDGTVDLCLQQLLHKLYMEHPELQAYIPQKLLVSFKKSMNLGSCLVRAGAELARKLWNVWQLHLLFFISCPRFLGLCVTSLVTKACKLCSCVLVAIWKV